MSSLSCVVVVSFSFLFQTSSLWFRAAESALTGRLGQLHWGMLGFRSGIVEIFAGISSFLFRSVWHGNQIDSRTAK